jgi:hypothetical protein
MPSCQKIAALNDNHAAEKEEDKKDGRHTSFAQKAL